MQNNNKNLIKKEFLIYTDENGDVKVNVMLINDDLWLTQELIAELFGKARNTITGHIKNIFAEGELDEKSNVEKIDIANSDKPVKIYNLNVKKAEREYDKFNKKQKIISDFDKLLIETKKLK